MTILDMPKQAAFFECLNLENKSHMKGCTRVYHNQAQLVEATIRPREGGYGLTFHVMYNGNMM